MNVIYSNNVRDDIYELSKSADRVITMKNGEKITKDINDFDDLLNIKTVIIDKKYSEYYNGLYNCILIRSKTHDTIIMPEEENCLLDYNDIVFEYKVPNTVNRLSINKVIVKCIKITKKILNTNSSERCLQEKQQEEIDFHISKLLKNKKG